MYDPVNNSSDVSELGPDDLENIAKAHSNTQMPQMRLFTNDRDHSSRDLVLSSQEPLSIDVPTYKITKKCPIIQSCRSFIKGNTTSCDSLLRNNSPSKSTNCDIMHKKNTRRKSSLKHESGNNVKAKTSSTPEPSISDFKYFVNNDKKLMNLNSTPESSNSIFPSDSIYFNIPSSRKGDHFKKTYGRSKSKVKASNAIQTLFSDYSENLKSKATVTNNSSGYLNFENLVKLESSCNDPIRDEVFQSCSATLKSTCIEESKPKQRPIMINTAVIDETIHPSTNSPAVSTRIHLEKNKNKCSKSLANKIKKPSFAQCGSSIVKHINKGVSLNSYEEMEVTDALVNTDTELCRSLDLLDELDLETEQRTYGGQKFNAITYPNTATNNLLNFSTRQAMFRNSTSDLGEKKISSMKNNDNIVDLKKPLKRLSGSLKRPVVSKMKTNNAKKTFKSKSEINEENYISSNKNTVEKQDCSNLELFRHGLDEDVCVTDEHPNQQSNNSMPNSLNLNKIVQFGKFCVMEAKDEVSKVQVLAVKERDNNLTAFDLKIQSTCTNLYAECEKLEIVMQNLMKIKALMESTYKIQNDIVSHIRSEALQLEDGKKQLLKNVSKIDQMESKNTLSAFRKLGQYIRSLLFSFIEKNIMRNNVRR